ncbi:MAG: hypothetical protein M1470_13570 [Bacteroidetes bacterium]|nr:hypothetical protein [Bacteroidota bacterium]MCL5738452.1 hypothetical protein [Bacteroidota bacterium]
MLHVTMLKSKYYNLRLDKGDWRAGELAERQGDRVTRWQGEKEMGRHGEEVW